MRNPTSMMSANVRTFIVAKNGTIMRCFDISAILADKAQISNALMAGDKDPYVGPCWLINDAIISSTR
jgi:hypothetical protein